MRPTRASPSRRRSGSARAGDAPRRSLPPSLERQGNPAGDDDLAAGDGRSRHLGRDGVPAIEETEADLPLAGGKPGLEEEGRFDPKLPSIAPDREGQIS